MNMHARLSYTSSEHMTYRHYEGKENNYEMKCFCPKKEY